MPQHLRSFECVPGVTLAALFLVFAFTGSEVETGDSYLVGWRVAAVVVAGACAFGAWKLDKASVRTVAGAASVSWIMLWAVFVIWQDPVSVDTSFMAFMFALAVLSTWYWSHSPVMVVVSDSETHSAHAVGTVRVLPQARAHEHYRWADIIGERATERESVLEAEA